MNDINELDREPKALILYTDYHGNTKWRRIAPIMLLWQDGSQYHPEPGWVLQAFDVDKGCLRTFMCRNIHKWVDKNDNGTLARGGLKSTNDIVKGNK
jgi:predicted DNA-binding transcriptional regulator YafY